MDLCDLNTIRLLLGRHGFRFSRSMGQNFLIEGWVPDGLVEGAGVSLQNGVLEIGPGIGPLTMRLKWWRWSWTALSCPCSPKLWQGGTMWRSSPAIF